MTRSFVDNPADGFVGSQRFTDEMLLYLRQRRRSWAYDPIVRLRNRILVSLAVGVGATFAIAWARAIQSPTSVETWIDSDLIDFGSSDREIPARVWAVHEPRVPVDLVVSNRSYSGSSALAFDAWTLRTIEDRSRYVATAACETGWPARALRAHHTVLVVDESYSEWESGILMRLPDGTWVPWHPLWPGFVINCVFYGVAGWLVIFAPFDLRRALRHRTGRCQACGYRVANGTCPECGTVVA